MPLLIFSYTVIAVCESNIWVNDLYTMIPIQMNHYNHTLNGPLWSIIIEWQLYILMPIWTWLFRALPINLKKIEIRVTEFVFASIALSLLGSFVFLGGYRFDDYTLFSAIPFYIFGFYLYQQPDVLTDISTIRQRIYWLITIILLISCYNEPDFSLCGKFIPFLATLSFLAGNWSKVQAEKIWGLFDFLGKATYEIYVLHGLNLYLYSKFICKSHVGLMICVYWLIPVVLGASIIWAKGMRQKSAVY